MSDESPRRTHDAASLQADEANAALTPQMQLEQVLNRLSGMLAADAKDQLSVIKHQRRLLTKSAPNTWQAPLAKALLVERLQIIELRGEVAAIHPAPSGTTEVLALMDGTAAGLLSLVASLATSNDPTSAKHLVTASQSAFSRAKTAGANALHRLG